MAQNQADPTPEAEKSQVVEIDPNKEYIVSVTATPVWERARRVLSQLLVNLTVITSLLIFMGFFVVQTYLAKITGIYTYRIDAAVYIGAGVNVILGTLYIVVSRLLGDIPDIIIPMIIVLGLTLVIGLISIRDERAKRYLEERFLPVVLFVQRLNNILALSLLLALLAATAVTYGQYGYEYSDHALGGGKPTTVILIFQNAQALADLGLPLATNTAHPGQSEPVQLLMELSDGVLVRQSPSGIPVIIRDDLLYGIMDVSATTATTPVATSSSPTPTLAPTPTT